MGKLPAALKRYQFVKGGGRRGTTPKAAPKPASKPASKKSKKSK